MKVTVNDESSMRIIRSANDLGVPDEVRNRAKNYWRCDYRVEDKLVCAAVPCEYVEITTQLPPSMWRCFCGVHGPVEQIKARLLGGD